MTATDAPVQLEETIEIAAPPEVVWRHVTDVRRMAAWSPHGLRTFVRGEMGEGTGFVNVNRRGLLVWPTTATVVRYTPHRDFAFRVRENWVVWSFALEPTADGGTRVTQRRETPRGIAPISNRLVGTVIGGVPSFTAELATGMQVTLKRIKAAAER